MIKQYKVRHSEVIRDFRDMYSEFKCDESRIDDAIEYMREGRRESWIKERIPSFVLIREGEWDTYDSECDSANDDIEEESEVEQPVKKNHLPSWY